MSKPINLDKPRFDQSSYWGRAKHFFLVTNPLNVLATDAQLDEAKQVVMAFKKSGKLPAGMTEDQLWDRKYLYDSAFHPDTGEKVLVIGRMSAQVPMNTLITGCMISFYKSNAAAVFWQWLNQTFNAIVNYSNRSGKAEISTKALLTSYVAACGGAMGTALYLNNIAKKMKNPMYGRLVPFVAVAGANFINIPMMRSKEIISGTPVYTLTTEEAMGESKIAARTGILLVCLSRCGMAVPGMTLTPLLTNILTQRGAFCQYPMAVIPFQLVMVAFCLTFATPLGCALFEQRARYPVSGLEPELQEKMQKKYPKEKEVWYNKGL